MSKDEIIEMLLRAQVGRHPLEYNTGIISPRSILGLAYFDEPCLERIGREDPVSTTQACCRGKYRPERLLEPRRSRCTGLSVSQIRPAYIAQYLQRRQCRLGYLKC